MASAPKTGSPGRGGALWAICSAITYDADNGTLWPLPGRVGWRRGQRRRRATLGPPRARCETGPFPRGRHHALPAAPGGNELCTSRPCSGHRRARADKDPLCVPVHCRYLLLRSSRIAAPAPPGEPRQRPGRRQGVKVSPPCRSRPPRSDGHYIAAYRPRCSTPSPVASTRGSLSVRLHDFQSGAHDWPFGCIRAGSLLRLSAQLGDKDISATQLTAFLHAARCGLRWGWPRLPAIQRVGTGSWRRPPGSFRNPASQGLLVDLHMTSLMNWFLICLGDAHQAWVFLTEVTMVSMSRGLRVLRS